MTISVFEVLVFKWMFERGGMQQSKASLIILINMLIYGSFGTVCLLICTCLGHGLYYMTLTSMIALALSGIFLQSGLTLYMVSVSIGDAGLSISLFNSYAGI